MHIHELNGILVNLVKFLATGYEEAIRLLNPLVKPCACKLDISDKGLRDITNI